MTAVPPPIPPFSSTFSLEETIHWDSGIAWVPAECQLWIVQEAVAGSNLHEVGFQLGVGTLKSVVGGLLDRGTDR